MSSALPRISVIIPAYNQARYLPMAIQSVLAQTYRDFEIIVVDDGSTDDTSVVAKGFGTIVRYVRQENRGLAGARNTGIRLARGQFLAPLDSDDEWVPTALERLVELATLNPGAAVYHGGWRYIDEQGRELPQAPHLMVVPPDQAYRTMVRGNYLAVGTVLMRREIVVEAGAFDESLRRVEDWNLWLRLLQGGHAILGSSDCVLRYRLHDGSLSTDPEEMYKATLAVVEGLFGPDDGRFQGWSEEKRMAYGGAYIYRARMAVLQAGDWSKCAVYLHRALEADPSVAQDLGIFYELALGSQPKGYRATTHRLEFEQNAVSLQGAVGELFDREGTAGVARLRRRVRGTLYYALGLVARNSGRLSLGRHFLLLALAYRPELALDRRFVSSALRSVVGESNLGRLRSLRATLGRV